MNDMVNELLKWNITSLFMLHPIGLSKEKLMGLGFINAFIKDEDYENPNNLNLVFLLFRPKNMDRFKYFVDLEKARTPLFIDEYDSEYGFVVLVYEFPGELAEDYQRIIDGKYSRLSKEYQDNMVVKLGFTYKSFIDESLVDAYSVQYMIIHRMEEWRAVIAEEFAYNFTKDDEHWTKMDQEKETITLDKLRKLDEQSKSRSITLSLSNYR